IAPFRRNARIFGRMFGGIFGDVFWCPPMSPDVSFGLPEGVRLPRLPRLPSLFAYPPVFWSGGSDPQVRIGLSGRRLRTIPGDVSIPVQLFLFERSPHVSHHHLRIAPRRWIGPRPGAEESKSATARCGGKDSDRLRLQAPPRRQGGRPAGRSGLVPAQDD